MGQARKRQGLTVKVQRERRENLLPVVRTSEGSGFRGHVSWVSANGEKQQQ